MDVFKIRKTREHSSSNTATGTLDSLHQGIVQTLKDSKIIQETLRQEMEELQAEISRLYISNDIANIVKDKQMEQRVREVQD